MTHGSNPADYKECLQSKKTKCEKSLCATELFWLQENQRSVEALGFARQATRLARESDCEKQLSYAYSALGYWQMINGSLDSAKYYYLLCDELRTNLNDSAGILGTCINLCRVYGELGVLEKARESYSKGLSYARTAWDSIEIRIEFISLLRKNSELAEALELFLLNRKVASSNKLNNWQQGDIYLSGANLFHDQRNYGKAFYFASLSVKCYDTSGQEGKQRKAELALGNVLFNQSKLDSSLIFYKLVLKHKLILGDTIAALNVMVNIGRVFDLMNKKDSALLYYKKVDSLSRSFTSPYLKFTSAKRLADYFKAEASWEKAEECYENAQRFEDRIAEKYLLLDFYKNYGDVLRKLDKHKEASKLHIQYVEVQEFIQKEWERLAELELKLKDADLKAAIDEQNLLKQKNRSDRMQFYTAVTVGVILFLSLFIIYQRERTNRKLSQKGVELANKEIDELLQQQELKSIMNVLEIQERERNRIARDIHDKLGGNLGTIQLMFSGIHESLKKIQEDVAKSFEKAIVLLKETGNDVRDLAHSLRSGPYEKLGLTSALGELIDTIERSESVKFEFNTHNVPRLSTMYESNIYRMVQEMLSNTLKHAQASEISLQLLFDEDRLNVLYEDNGIGFETTSAKQGMGLKNIASRVKDMVGEFKVDSAQGAGTRYDITVPIKHQSNE